MHPLRFAAESTEVILGSFDVPEALIGVPFQMVVTGASTYRVTMDNGQIFDGFVGAPLSLPDGLALEVAAITATVGREYTLYREPLRDSVDRLRDNLSVRERAKSGVVDFTFSGGDQAEAISVVNAVVASYQEQNLRRYSTEIDLSITFIERQLPEIRAELTTSTRALSDYREQQQSAQLSLGTQELLSRLVEIQTALEDLDFREEELAETLTPNHPDYRAFVAERERFQIRLEEIRGSLQDLPEAEQELARLTERVEGARQLEQQLILRVEQHRVLRASTVGNIRVLEPAEVARLVGPNRLIPALAGVGIGLALAALLIFGINPLRCGIEDGREIESLGLSLFGSVTKVAGLHGKRSGDDDYMLALHRCEDLSVEAIRGLRTGLQFSLGASGSKSVMITSCVPSEGKSFISLNLAIVSAQTGKAVLLIDADMRRGELSKNFGLTRRVAGLSDYLAGRKPLSDCVVVDQRSGVEFIGTGQFPPNPAELQAGKKLDELLELASEHYDLVIVDAPPALAETEPGIIGQKTGVNLLIVKHLVITIAEVTSAQKTLLTSGVNISGVVINQYDEARSRYGNDGSRYN